MSAPPYPRRLRLSRIAILSGLLGLLALTAPWAAATGSGYNQSYSRAGGSVAIGAVDLTSVSSTDTGASNLTISFSVSGTLNLHSSSYGYLVWFGGSSTANSSGLVTFSNASTGTYSFYSGSYSSGTLPFTNTGSTLTFTIAKASVGPSSSFGVNVYAYEGASGSAAYSWLGTNYAGGGSGGATCTTVGCVTTATNNAIATAVLFGIIALVVVVVVIVLVVVLVMRKKKAPPPQPMMPGMMAPPPPPPPPQP